MRIKRWELGKKLRETLTGIQDGALEDKHGWVCKIDVD